MNENTIYLYDGSLEGMLDAVARAVKSSSPIGGIYDRHHYRPTVYECPIILERDNEQAHKLFCYLRTLRPAARLALNAFLSEELEAATHLCTMVKLCVSNGSSILGDYTNPSIQYLEALSRKVGFEAHRFAGLLRFRVLASGVQYAPFEPDHNVIGYCALHFIQRLAARQWILHDIKRNIALYWDGTSVKNVEIDREMTEMIRRCGEIPKEMLGSDEQYYQELWKSFHASIYNPSRKNLNLQRQCMPQRYWKYLVEMQI